MKNATRLRPHFFTLRKTLGNNRGVALLMALTFVLIMMFLAVEVSYDSQVEYRVASAELDRLRAYYAAKAGTEFSLFRIFLFRKATNQMGKSMGAQASMLNLIWQFPFTWPPTLPDTIIGMDKEKVEKSVSDSFFDGQFVAVIGTESDKIDINDLASPSEALAKATFDQIVQLLENRRQQEDDWAEANRNLDIKKIVGSIADWVDKDSEGRNGGDESSAYSNLKTDQKLPPNEPMKNLSELHMVAGMTDDLYAILEPRLTVYGLKGINVNRASKEILKSIDPLITDEIADEIIAWRDDQSPGKGPWTEEPPFLEFIKGRGINVEKFNQKKLPLYFGSEKNFRIKSTGVYGRSSREIIAITYDFDTVKGRLKSLLTTTTMNSTSSTSSTSSTTTTTVAPPDGRPNVVHWEEN